MSVGNRLNKCRKVFGIGILSEEGALAQVVIVSGLRMKRGYGAIAAASVICIMSREDPVRFHIPIGVLYYGDMMRLVTIVEPIDPGRYGIMKHWRFSRRITETASLRTCMIGRILL
jgi:hypothetical protein